jgi:hypothetical protein
MSAAPLRYESNVPTFSPTVSGIPGDENDTATDTENGLVEMSGWMTFGWLFMSCFFLVWFVMRFSDIMGGGDRNQVVLEEQQGEEEQHASSSSRAQRRQKKLGKKLPKRNYDPKTDANIECAICLCAYEPGDVITTSTCTCTHEYHRDCMAEWLVRQKHCPICRTIFLKEDARVRSQETDNGQATAATSSREVTAPS